MRFQRNRATYIRDGNSAVRRECGGSVDEGAGGAFYGVLHSLGGGGGFVEFLGLLEFGAFFGDDADELADGFVPVGEEFPGA